MSTRAIRANNPLQVRISDTPWKGKLEESVDPEFETFDTAVLGIRAGAKVILGFADEHGMGNTNGVISRMAQQVDLDVATCVESVEEYTGFDRTLILDLHQPFVLAKLVQAIILYLQRRMPYSTEEIATAIQIALI